MEVLKAGSHQFLFMTDDTFVCVVTVAQMVEQVNTLDGSSGTIA